MDRVRVDFQQITGQIKPVHGVNNGPVTCNFWYDASEYFLAANIPYCRLHDTEYPFGSGEFVDIACIFKDFSADAEDPASYNFTLTDDYLRCIREVGAEIVYRLGASIEHQPVKRNIIPPADYLKWAKICEHIIRHYNEGWANGYFWNIEYWEIWNEPEFVNYGISRCWTGTKEEFFEFYRVVATHLKERFPQLKIGGPAFTAPDHDYAKEFLRFVTQSDSQIPLDFYSWHGYVKNVEEAKELAKRAKGMLQDFDLTETESFYDEWNYVPSWNEMETAYEKMKTAEGAALCAGTLCVLQQSPVEKAMYYDAQLRWENEWCGLFAPGKTHRHAIGNKVIPLKPYYSFYGFGVLYKLRKEIFTSVEGEYIYACGATDGMESALLLACFTDKEIQKKKVQIQWADEKLCIQVYLLDEEHDLDLIKEYEDSMVELEVRNHSVYLLRFRH